MNFFHQALDLDIGTNRYQADPKGKKKRKRAREKPKQTTSRKRRAEGSRVGGAPTGMLVSLSRCFLVSRSFRPYLWHERYLSTSSTAQGGGGSFKNRKRIGEIDCCE